MKISTKTQKKIIRRCLHLAVILNAISLVLTVHTLIQTIKGDD